MPVIKGAALIDLLTAHSSEFPDRLAFTFLSEDENHQSCLTYQALIRQAQAVAVELSQAGLKDKPVLLLYDASEEYVCALIACFFAGAIAVPMFPPRRKVVDLPVYPAIRRRQEDRLRAVIDDCQPKGVLTTNSLLWQIRTRLKEVQSLYGTHWLVSDKINTAKANDWKKPDINGDSLAILEYTSGVTCQTKGVAISYNNLMHTLHYMHDVFQLSEKSIFVSWLPLFQGMGLIGCVLLPLFSGSRSYLLSSSKFLQKPFFWLDAISKYRGTITFAPNFAFDLCLRKITPKERKSLDLSCCKVAVNGSEVISSEIMRNFINAFKSVGFYSKALCPGYGLAEATLAVACSSPKSQIKEISVDAYALRRNHIILNPKDISASINLISCGKTNPKMQVVIVDPMTKKPCSANKVGEIYLRGPTVATGYWQQTKATNNTFQVKIHDGNESLFLQTGDLGFIHQNELFVTGRLSDLISINGRKYYPQDIEKTLQATNLALRKGCGVAFSISMNNHDCLVVVQELRHHNLPELTQPEIKMICNAVKVEHGIQLYNLVLIRPGSLLKTHTGKNQRKACCNQYLSGDLQVLSEWVLGGKNHSQHKKQKYTQRVNSKNVNEEPVKNNVVENSFSSYEKLHQKKTYHRSYPSCEFERNYHLLALSANSEQSLISKITHYSQHYSKMTDKPKLADICYSTNINDRHLPYRCTLLINSHDQLDSCYQHIILNKKICNYSEKGIYKQNSIVPKSGTAFLFSGQGAEYTGMGKTLYQTQPLFKELLDRSDEVMKLQTEKSLLSILWGEDSALQRQTRYIQPALFALQYALARLWQSWGIKPGIVMGHSVGEYAAASIAGVFDLTDGLRLLIARGQLMDELTQQGTMEVLFANIKTVMPMLKGVEDRVALAAENGPTNVVISGDTESIQTIIKQLEAHGISHQRLIMRRAFHSPLMEPILCEFAKIAKSIQYSLPQIPIVSNLHGEIVDDSICHHYYWLEHARKTVCFNHGMETLNNENIKTFLEIGPGASLLGMGQRCVTAQGTQWLPTLCYGRDEWQQALYVLAKLYTSGHTINWSGFDDCYVRHQVGIPT